MIVMPVSVSPARIAAWIGAAPRQRGSRLAWMFRQPRRGASSIGLGQDQPIGRHHGGIQLECGECRLRRRIGAQPRRRAHRQTQLLRRDVHRAAAHCMAASGGPRRLAIDRGDVVPGRVQRPQGGHGEIRAAHEGEAHGALRRLLVALLAHAPWPGAA